jgi:hypothetical protein
MTFDYRQIAALSTNLLTQFGGSVSISRTTGKTINPVTGAVTPGTAQTLTAKGAVVEYEDRKIDGTMIQRGDKLVLIDAGFEPLQTDLVMIDAQPWQIIRIETVRPAAVAVLYKLQVRR